MKEIEKLKAISDAAVASAVNALDIAVDDKAIAAVDVALNALDAVYDYEVGDYRVRDYEIGDYDVYADEPEDE